MEPVKWFVGRIPDGAWPVRFNGRRHDFDTRTLVIAIVSRIGFRSFEHIKSS